MSDVNALACVLRRVTAEMDTRWFTALDRVGTGFCRAIIIGPSLVRRSLSVESKHCWYRFLA